MAGGRCLARTRCRGLSDDDVVFWYLQRPARVQEFRKEIWQQICQRLQVDECGVSAEKLYGKFCKAEQEQASVLRRLEEVFKPAVEVDEEFFRRIPDQAPASAVEWPPRPPPVRSLKRMNEAKLLVDIAGQCKSLFYGKGEVPFDKGGGCFFVLGNDVSSTFRYPGNPPSEYLQQTSKDTRTF